MTAPLLQIAFYTHRARSAQEKKFFAQGPRKLTQQGLGINEILTVSGLSRWEGACGGGVGRILPLKERASCAQAFAQAHPSSGDQGEQGGGGEINIYFLPNCPPPPGLWF